MVSEDVLWARRGMREEDEAAPVCEEQARAGGWCPGHGADTSAGCVRHLLPVSCTLRLPGKFNVSIDGLAGPVVRHRDAAVPPKLWGFPLLRILLFLQW